MPHGRGYFNGGSPGSPSDPNHGSGNTDSQGIPKVSGPESIQQTKSRVSKMQEQNAKLEEVRDSESESEDGQCELNENGSGDYGNVMKQLEKQSSKAKVEVKVGDETYTVKNPYRESAEELQFKVAEKMYDSIRDCDTDTSEIAKHLSYKEENIKRVKEHVFYNEHSLDRYGPDEIEHKRFDATLEQALAWKRLESGTHTQDDII